MAPYQNCRTSTTPHNTRVPKLECCNFFLISSGWGHAGRIAGGEDELRQAQMRHEASKSVQRGRGCWSWRHLVVLLAAPSVSTL